MEHKFRAEARVEPLVNSRYTPHDLGGASDALTLLST